MGSFLAAAAAAVAEVILVKRVSMDDLMPRGY